MNSVLITGATGYLGRALVKELLQRDTERICIFSRDEAKQASMRAQIADPHEQLRWFVGDVRDRQRLRHAMAGIDTVISGAALKRIETGFYNPGEMIKTNVIGAMNVIEAATDAGVSKIVQVSTDKAFQPISPYGHSKALAEALYLNANNARGRTGPICSVVRYGNIWNSTGSVVPTWQAALRRGETLTVTDPNCTRFFMLIEEAVRLVLDTAETMTGGEIAIPDLPAYRLGDLMMALVDKACPKWRMTGLPHFEKLHESMDADRCSETARRMTINELREGLAKL